MLGALAFWLVFVPVEVAGDSTCPAPDDVTRRLAEVLPRSEAEAGPRRVARVSRVENGVSVELLDATGKPIATRTLAGDESCNDLADAVAVIIATWAAEIDPRVANQVRLPAAAARPAATPAPTPTIAAVPAAPAPPRPALGFDLGLGLLASLAGGQLAPGARVAGWIAPAGSRLGIGVAVSGATARSEPVGSLAGAARWSRIAFAAGPAVRFNAAHTVLGAHLHALGALLQVEGVGLPMNASDASAQFGMGLGGHVGRPWGNATPWIGADLLVWPGRERLEISGLAAGGELPRLELQLAVGISLGRFR